MAWPLSQDYNEAIQSPAICLADPELKAGSPATNALGIPQPRSGNFADVYEFLCPAAGNRWALKCFTREVKGLRERYAQISDYLQQARLPFTVEFHYLEQGLRIRGNWYPALKMRWIEGLLLNEFVRDNLDKPARLQALSQIWLRMAKRLREAGLAHADLQHGNVILVPGSTANSLAVKLIDYDGMFVPALGGMKSGEVGHPNFQHPQRLKEGTYNAEVDRFPVLVVATALQALAAPGGKALWQRYDNGDNLLFKESDLRSPGESALFQELSQAADPLTRKLVGALEKGCSGRLEDVPLLEELLSEEKPSVKTAIKGPGALARTAAGAPDWDFDREEPAPVGPVRRRGTSVPAWAWAVGGVGAAILVLGGILLATRLGREKTPNVAQNNPTRKVLRPKKPAPIKPVAKPPDHPPQKIPGEGEKPPPEPGPGDVPPPPDPVVAPLPPGGDSPLDRLNPEKIPGSDRLAGVKELVAVLKGHKDHVWNVALSPDGQCLASSSADKTVCLWDLGGPEPRLRHVFDGYKNPIPRLVFTPDSKTLIFGTDGQVEFWDLSADRPRLRHQMPGGDYLALSADGSKLAHAMDTDIHLIDLSGPVPRDTGFALKGHSVQIMWLVFFPDGSKLASASRDKSVRLWDLTQTPPKIKTVIDHPSPVMGMAVSPDGKTMVTGTDQGIVKVEDLTTSVPRQLFSHKAHDNWANSASFAPDGKTFITTGGGAPVARNQLVWWNTADGSRRAAWDLPASCSTGVFAEDGRNVAVTCDNGKVYILRLAPAEKLVAGGPLRVIPHSGSVLAVCAVDKAGKQFISADGTEPRLWNADTGEEVHRFKGHTKQVEGLAISPDGRRLLTASEDETMRLWDIGTGKEIRQFKHPSPVHHVAFSHNGKYALSASGGIRNNKDGTQTPTDRCLRVWDLAKGDEERGRYEGLDQFPMDVRFSPDDGQVLAIYEGGAILVWDVASKKMVKRLRPPVGRLACVLPDGKQVIMNDERSLQLWDLDAFRKVRDLPLEKEKQTTAGAVSPDGLWLVTGTQLWKDGVSYDPSVRFWDVTTGRELAQYRGGHSRVMGCMAISPDGKRAFSGSFDRTVCVWDLKSPGPVPVVRDPVSAPEKPAPAVKNLLFKGVINCAVSSRSFPIPKRFDITKRWELSLEAKIPNLDKSGLIFFIGDERGGRDPIMIAQGGNSLHFSVDNAFTGARQAISTRINPTMLRKWTTMTFRYTPTPPELQAYLNGKQVARDRCMVTPAIDRLMFIWIGSENTNNQRFFGEVRSVRLVNK